MPIEKRSSKGIEVVALAFTMVFPTFMAWTYFVALARSDSDPTVGNTALRTAYSVGKVVQFGFPLLFLGLFEPRCLRPGKPHFRGLAIGLEFGLLVGVGILVLYYGFLRPALIDIGTPARLRTKVEEFGAATPRQFIALAVFLSVAHSLLEEYYWRWFVFGRLRQHVATNTAIGVSSLGFMAHHVVVLYVYMPGHFLDAAVPLSLCIAVGGAVWAWLYQRSGSIYSPWLSHLLVDAAIMAVGYNLLFGP